MAKRGRPTSYREEYADQAYRLCLLGMTDAQMAEYFGVVEKTLNTWKEKVPEFLQSLKEGKEQADARVAQSLFKRATGYQAQEYREEDGDKEDSRKVVNITKEVPPETTAAIFWLKNRQPDRWRDRVQHEHTADDDLIQAMQRGRERVRGEEESGG